MSRRVLVTAGAVLTVGCFVLLAVGYAPEAFHSPRPPLDVVGVAPKCSGAVKTELNLGFQQPRFWASMTGVNVIIPVVEGCTSLRLSTTNKTAIVRMVSTEAVFTGEKRVTNKLVTAQTQTGPSAIFEIDTSRLSKQWSIIVENAYAARRDGFDRYTVTGVASFVKGDWTLKAGADPTYSTSGTTDWSMSVVKTERPEDNELLFETGAVFSRITEYKDIFGILVSTILGLGLSTLVQGLAMPAASRRRKNAPLPPTSA